MSIRRRARVFQCPTRPNGRPQRWLTLSDVYKRTGVDEQAVQLAASKGWINLEPKVDPHSVALLDAGRRLME
jgi:hypothetical protein